ncbi:MULTISPECIES: SdpI family protein [unclassified Sporolactobacillus]|uniref:SdpI family protein n=1 Tax=unclassified Sporolactobacillus TaxID=2628533 RepID=UPI002368780B|nr:SdpI family protein [Sporolactobacillus sp. CQH2019]MDD9146988.1 SdpI family protein [Sporolactobacillus sp. CQH2019]
MKKHLFPILLFLIALGLWIYFYPKIPARVPIHWGINGYANRYAPKLQAVILSLGIMIVGYALFLLIPMIDPRRKNYQYFLKSYERIRNISFFFFFIISCLTLFSSLNPRLTVPYITYLMVGCLFILLGNYMQSLKPNFFIGIRTPWTLSNETVWRKTHRMGSRVFIVSGACLGAGGFLPGRWPAVILVAVLVLTIAFSYIYSYWIFRNLNGFQ